MADILSTDDSQFRNVTTQIPGLFAPGLTGMPNLQLDALGQYFSDMAKYKAAIARDQQMWQRRMAEREFALKEKLATPPPTPVEHYQPQQVNAGQEYTPLFSELAAGSSYQIPGYTKATTTYSPGKVAVGSVPSQLSSLYQGTNKDRKSVV